MNFRIDSSEANFRATPNTAQAPLARLPVGHLVTATAPPANDWQPCQTKLSGHTLNGFVKASLLRPPINPEVDRLIELAGAEYREFLFGTRNETHPDSKPEIKKYWQAFNGTTEPVSVAWSAVFISYIVRQANLTKSFKFAKAHTTYFGDSKLAFQNGDASRAYWAVPLGHSKLQIGDLIGYYRIDNPNTHPPICGTAPHGYGDLPGEFCSHSDVVVAIRSGKAITIGGNVSNTVKVTEVTLDPAGEVPSGNKRILVMKRNF